MSNWIVIYFIIFENLALYCMTSITSTSKCGDLKIFIFFHNLMNWALFFSSRKQPFVSLVTSPLFLISQTYKNLLEFFFQKNIDWNISMTSLMNRIEDVVYLLFIVVILEYWSWGYWTFFLKKKNFFGTHMPIISHEYGT